jgi:hypothetical protein
MSEREIYSWGGPSGIEVEERDGALSIVASDGHADGPVFLPRSEVIALRDALTEWIGDGGLHADFLAWCKANNLQPSPDQSAMAKVMLAAAMQTPSLGKFLAAIGAGRSWLMDTVARYFGALMVGRWSSLVDPPRELRPATGDHTRAKDAWGTAAQTLADSLTNAPRALATFDAPESTESDTVAGRYARDMATRGYAVVPSSLGPSDDGQSYLNRKDKA